MITKEAYLRAKDLVKSYEEQLASEHITYYTCMVCKEQKIHPVANTLPHPLHQEDSMWEGGTVLLLSFGYGSTLDEKSFYGGICDGCMKEALREGRAVSYSSLQALFREEG